MHASLRELFPAVRRTWNGYPLVYFDSAATTLKPQSVIDAVSDFDEQLGSTVHRGVYALAQEATFLYQQARHKVAQFLGGVAFEEVIFTRGTTASLNLLSKSFAATFCQPGDIILLTEIEHHSNLIPWQMIAQQYHLTLEFIPVNEKGELVLDAPFPERTKMVSLAHVSNILGTVHPIDQIVKKAKEVGAYVCVDGAQSVAHMNINVKELGVDFFAFSGHKLYGPTGVGVLYGRKELLQQMVPVEGGGDMIHTVSLRDFTAADLPYKFEAGTPMIGQVIGLAAAIDFVNMIGLDRVYQHEQQLLYGATRALESIPGLHIVGQASKKSSIISFKVDQRHPLDLVTLLDCRSVALRTGHLCSQPAMHRFGVSSLCRISFGVYNQLEEVERFIEFLLFFLKM